MRYPRYTTYRDDELEAVIREADPEGKNGVTVAELRQGNSAPMGSRQIRFKEHSCPVTYPDGREGTCKYVRGGPNWHVFNYRHRDDTRDSNVESGLPIQHFTLRLENTIQAIETKAQELAQKAFDAAIRAEQTNYFKRATPPTGYQIDSTLFQFSPSRAKDIGGKYALCLRLGKKLIPNGCLFDTLKEANRAWQEAGNDSFVVACACRWSRCWEEPRFNPLRKQARTASLEGVTASR